MQKQATRVEIPKSHKFRRLVSLLRDMLRILLMHPYWLVASFAFTILTAALAPSQAWMWKSFIDGLKRVFEKF
jgi:hypothetical protein